MTKSTAFLFAAAVMCGMAVTSDSVFAADVANTPSRPWAASEQAQQARIRQGVKTGELTQEEAKRLEMEERKRRLEKLQFKADKNLTPAEKARLKADRNKTSREIYLEKHDSQKQVTPPPKPWAN